MKQIQRLNELQKIAPGTEVIVRGKIAKIRKLGKLNFVILRDQTGYCQTVFENEAGLMLLNGDHVSVQGLVNAYGDRIEVHVSTYKLLGSSNPRNCPCVIPSLKTDRLLLRSLAMQAVATFLSKQSFLPVTSPTIVGSWVEGRTSTFDVDYYGEKKYLTLNSMLYHQVMLISGYNRIYEFSKIFRKDDSSAKDRLSEFVSLDISMTDSDKYGMMTLVESMIFDVLDELSACGLCNLSWNISFDRISFQELMERSGCHSITGAQLSTKARAYLRDNYQSFVWVYGFPEEKRRFFVKSIDGTCQDYQLWFGGDHQVASGGERETDLTVIHNKLLNENKRIENYSEILGYFESGVPPMCEIGFGFERFMLDITNSDKISDLVAFPRNKNTEF